jgi:phosphonate metabolism protein PhnN/1,5-bisphosphokinase (PRPP-forming)
MKGQWVFVCGPSGAGKDSVINSASQLLGKRSDIVFARRLVTRAVHPGTDHDAVSESAFLALLQSGGLCWHWRAHGFYYGIARRYADDVLDGRRVVVNGSRDHVLGLAPSPERRVVEITAAAHQLAARLALRGRDVESAMAERLARNSSLPTLRADCVIVNDAALAVAGQRLADYLTG